MNVSNARRVLAADCCRPAAAQDDRDTPSHLVHPPMDRTHRKLCDGRAMPDPVLTDSERPTCPRCRVKFDTALAVLVSTQAAPAGGGVDV